MPAKLFTNFINERDVSFPLDKDDKKESSGIIGAEESIIGDEEIEEADDSVFLKASVETVAFSDNDFTKNESDEFVCNRCGKIFQSRQKMKRHWNDVHSGIKLSCDQCNYMCARKDNLNSHIRNKHH